MIRLKNTRQIIIGFFIFAIIFFVYSDSIVAYISTLHPILILLAATLLNPVYLILIWALFETYGLRGAIAGFLISTASDMISLPHVLLKSGEYSQASYSLVTESTFWQLIPAFLKNSVTLPLIGQTNLGVFLIYVVASTALIVAALMVAHRKKFKQIFLKSI